MNFNKLSVFNKENHSTLYKYIIWFLLLAIGFSLVSKELFSLDLTVLLITLRNQGALKVISFFIGGIIAVSLMSIYDFILRKEFSLNISIKDTFKIAWMSNIIGNFLGEQSTTEGGISYLLYQSEGIDTNKATIISIIKNTLFISPDDSSIEFLKLSIKTRFYLLLGMLIKWLASACLFIYILKNFSVSASIPSIFIVFILSMSISLFTRIPGGIGIFELVCLYSFRYLGTPIQISILGILMYRLFYYIVPWIITLFILAIKPRLNKKIKLSSENRRLLQLMGVQATASLIFFAGLLLIISSSLPNIENGFSFIENLFTTESIHISRLTGMGIGLLLLILSKGIYNKVRSSYYLSLVFLSIGAIFTLVKDINWTESLFLVVIALVLYSGKDCFYREARVLSFKKLLLGFITLASFSFSYLLLYTLFIESIGTPLANIFQIIFSSWQEFAIFLIIIGIGTLLLNLISVNKVDFATPTLEDLNTLSDFLTKYPGNSMTHLLFLKDKSLFYAQNNQVLIAFRPYKDNLMVLGDPIGNPSLFKESINEFRVYADKFNMTPIFYEVSEDNLPIYHENGFNFLKLGEEATLHLSEFTLIGKKGAQLRTIKNKMLRKELEFDMLKPPISSDIMERLRKLSDEWLGERKEKGFSLGYFDEEYINLAPVALIKKDEEIIAFATIMPTYHKDTISIDLMRLVQTPPNGTMDALFIGIIEWAIDNNYKYFVLGKAPLSNVGLNQFSNRREKLVKHFYNYGNKIYSFKGLRRFKEKFYPEWKGIYLAYPKNTRLSIAIINLTRLISGSDH